MSYYSGNSFETAFNDLFTSDLFLTTTILGTDDVDLLGNGNEDFFANPENQSGFSSSKNINGDAIHTQQTQNSLNLNIPPELLEDSQTEYSTLSQLNIQVPEEHVVNSPVQLPSASSTNTLASTPLTPVTSTPTNSLPNFSPLDQNHRIAIPRASQPMKRTAQQANFTSFDVEEPQPKSERGRPPKQVIWNDWNVNFEDKKECEYLMDQLATALLPFSIMTLTPKGKYGKNGFEEKETIVTNEPERLALRTSLRERIYHRKHVQNQSNLKRAINEIQKLQYTCSEDQKRIMDVLTKWNVA